MTQTRQPAVAEELCDELLGRDFGPFFGTPCGILAPLYTFLLERAGLVTVAREDNAVGIAAGTALAGRCPVVLMQNSGLGQSVNAIASLVVPYRIPLLLVVSMRGIDIDPTQENEVMGRITAPLLASLGVDPIVLGDPASTMDKVHEVVREERRTVALLIPPAAFGWRA